MLLCCLTQKLSTQPMVRVQGRTMCLAENSRWASLEPSLIFQLLLKTSSTENPHKHIKSANRVSLFVIKTSSLVSADILDLIMIRSQQREQSCASINLHSIIIRCWWRQSNCNLLEFIHSATSQRSISHLQMKTDVHEQTHWRN